MAKTKSTTKKKTTTKKTATKKAPAKKSTKKKESQEVKVDRRTKNERRDSEDRRQKSVPVENDRRSQPERRKVARRRQIDPTTCERDYNGEEIEFMQALDAYKRAAGRMFPTCSEILEVLRDLGYRRLTPDEIATLGPPATETASDETGETSGDADDAENADEPSLELMEDSLDTLEG